MSVSIPFLVLQTCTAFYLKEVFENNYVPELIIIKTQIIEYHQEYPHHQENINKPEMNHKQDKAQRKKIEMKPKHYSVKNKYEHQLRSRQKRSPMYNSAKQNRYSDSNDQIHYSHRYRDDNADHSRKRKKTCVCVCESCEYNTKPRCATICKTVCKPFTPQCFQPVISPPMISPPPPQTLPSPQYYPYYLPLIQAPIMYYITTRIPSDIGKTTYEPILQKTTISKHDKITSTEEFSDLKLELIPTNPDMTKITTNQMSIPTTKAAVETTKAAVTATPTPKPAVLTKTTTKPTVPTTPTTKPTVTTKPTPKPTVTTKPTPKPTVTTKPTPKPTVTTKPTPKPTLVTPKRPQLNDRTVIDI